MRIALWHDLPPGGARRYLVETTARLALAHDVTLVTTRTGDDDADLLEHVAAVHRVPGSPPARGRVARLLAVRRDQQQLATGIDAVGFDVALVHGSQITQAPPLLSSLRTTPSLYVAQEPRRRTYERGYQPWLDPGGRVVRAARRTARRPFELVLARWDRAAVHAATGLVVNSEFMREAMGAAYGRTGVVVHPGVDFGRFTVGTGPRTGVLSVGALDPTKGHDLVVDAIARLDVEARPTFTVVFERMDPVYRDELRRRATTLGVDLRLRQGIDDKELADAYGEARVLVAASVREPFGLTPLEAGAAGTFVIAIDEGGFRETVQPGINGVLVSRRVDALAAALARELERPVADPWSLRDALLPYWTWDRAVVELDRTLSHTAAR